MDLSTVTSLAVLPRSATPFGVPLLVLAGNRFRTLRLVAEQPKPMPYVPPSNPTPFYPSAVVALARPPCAPREVSTRTPHGAISCGDCVAAACRIVAALFSSATLKFITVTATCVRVWDAVSGMIERSYDGHRICEGANVSAACLDARGRKLMLGDTDGKTMVCAASQSVAHTRMRQLASKSD